MPIRSPPQRAYRPPSSPPTTAAACDLLSSPFQMWSTFYILKRRARKLLKMTPFWPQESGQKVPFLALGGTFRFCRLCHLVDTKGSQKIQFLSTNIGQRLTKKSLGGVHLLWPTEVAEGRSGTEDRSKKAKNHMIQVDLIEVSSPQAEIFIQGRPNYR